MSYQFHKKERGFLVYFVEILGGKVHYFSQGWIAKFITQPDYNFDTDIQMQLPFFAFI